MNGNGTAPRQRQRLGGDMPYRDDPSAPALVHLESFTQNGTGSSTAFPAPEKSKPRWASSRRLLQRMSDCLGAGGGGGGGYNLHGASAPGDNMYYEDHFNDQSWSCSLGTTDDHGVWLNQSDPAGSIMCLLVWILIGYSSLTMTLLAQTGGVPSGWSMLYAVLAALALACHVKTTLTDPGSVPASAVPTQQQRHETTMKLCMCSQCQTFKPPQSHHCRICNRCISRMDHHCPWMNNCIGAANLKHFLLFLIYTWTISVFALLLLGWNYFFCANDECMFSVVLTQLVRLMTVLSVGSFLFTSSMLMNVIYGIMTGVGTIDRLKKKATGTMSDADEEAIPLVDVFGIGPYWTWALPLDPVFADYDRVMGYATPQRLLREQIMRDGKRGGGGSGPIGPAASLVSRDSFGTDLPV